MPRANPSYDEDFYLWTQDQAQALRQLPKAMVGNLVDLEHVAEEIEDLGKSELSSVLSLLTQLFTHLLKIAIETDPRNRTHWEVECLAFQKDAWRRFTPGMAQLIDLNELWSDAVERIQRLNAESNGPRNVADICPFDLSDVLSKRFDLDSAVRKTQTTLISSP